MAEASESNETGARPQRAVAGNETDASGRIQRILDKQNWLEGAISGRTKAFGEGSSRSQSAGIFGKVHIGVNEVRSNMKGLYPVGDKVTEYMSLNFSSGDRVLEEARKNGVEADSYLTATVISSSVPDQTDSSAVERWYNDNMYGDTIKHHYVIDGSGKYVKIAARPGPKIEGSAANEQTTYDVVRMSDEDLAFMETAYDMLKKGLTPERRTLVKTLSRVFRFGEDK